MAFLISTSDALQRKVSLLALFTLVVTGCGGGGGGSEPVPDPEPAPIWSLEIGLAGSPAQLTAGSSYSLVASAAATDGQQRNVLAQASWSSSSACASIASGAVLFAADQSCAATITASITLDGQTVTDSISVAAAYQPPLAPTLTAVSLTPESASLEVGQSQPFTATLAFSDSTTAPLAPANGSWSISPLTVATISSSGVVTAVGAGQATVQLTYDGKTDTSVVTVVAPQPELPVPEALNLSGDLQPVVAGDSWQLAASLLMSDQSQSDVTASALWSSSDDSVATVDDGAVSALKAGSVRITVTHQGLWAHVDLTVLPPVVTGITPDIFDGTETLTEGQTLTLDFTISYSDGSTTLLSQPDAIAVTRRSADFSDPEVSDRDPSGIYGVDIFADTVGLARHQVRAIRAGKTGIQVSFMDGALRDALIAGGYLREDEYHRLVMIDVAQSDDIYQWDKTTLTLPLATGETGTVRGDAFYHNDQAYFFYSSRTSAGYTGLHIARVTSTNTLVMTKLLDGAQLLDLHLLDGGGNGYALLMADISGVDHVYRVRLSDNQLTELDMSKFPWGASLTTDPDLKHQVPRFAADGTVYMMAKASTGNPADYIVYKMDEATQAWTEMGRRNGSFSIQLPSLPNVLAMVDASDLTSAPYVGPTFYLFDITTDTYSALSMKHDHPSLRCTNVGTMSLHVLKTQSGNFDGFSATCHAFSRVGGNEGVLVWARLELDPVAYVVADGNSVITDRPSVVTIGNATSAFAGNQIINGEAHTKLFAVTNTDQAVSAQILPYRNNQFDLYRGGIHPLVLESNHRTLANPYQPQETLMLTHSGLVTHADSSWSMDWRLIRTDNGTSGGFDQYHTFGHADNTLTVIKTYGTVSSNQVFIWRLDLKNSASAN